jgi:hypothetical protein
MLYILLNVRAPDTFSLSKHLFHDFSAILNVLSIHSQNSTSYLNLFGPHKIPSVHHRMMVIARICETLIGYPIICTQERCFKRDIPSFLYVAH